MVFGHLWVLWKDLKTPKTQRPWVFGEQGTLSRGAMRGLSKKQLVFQSHAGNFTENIFNPNFRSFWILLVPLGGLYFILFIVICINTIVNRLNRLLIIIRYKNVVLISVNLIQIKLRACTRRYRFAALLFVPILTKDIAHGVRDTLPVTVLERIDSGRILGCTVKRVVVRNNTKTTQNLSRSKQPQQPQMV